MLNNVLFVGVIEKLSCVGCISKLWGLVIDWLLVPCRINDVNCFAGFLLLIELSSLANSLYVSPTVMPDIYYIYKPNFNKNAKGNLMDDWKMHKKVPLVSSDESSDISILARETE